MTNQKTTLQESANAIIRQVVKKTTLLAALAVAGAIVLGIAQGPGQRWWFLPGGILFGAALGLINFRWLAMSVERFYVRKDVSPVAAKIIGAVISFLKLSAIFIVLFIVIKWELLHLLGLVGGLSLSFVAIIWEGLAMMARGRTEN
jgi:hypothetical protein